MLTIIVKGTNSCNLACSYCSLGQKKDFRYINARMLSNIMAYSCKIARKRREKSVTFILHGGEPSLVDVNVYQDSIHFIKEQFSDIEIGISMQSNGLAVSDELIRFIKENDVHMGISLDGSEEIHDGERYTADYKPTYNKILNNIQKLQNADIKVSCLMVLTRNALDKGFEYLKYYAEKHIHLKINPLLNYGGVYEHPELLLHSGDYANYLIKLYEYSIENDISVTIAPIDNILQAIIYGQRIYGCTYNKECSRNFGCIDYKGNMYPCGRFCDMDLFRIGNIDYYKGDFLDSELMCSILKRRNTRLPNKCRKCKYLRLCNAGCSAEAAIGGNINGEPMLCEDYQMLFEYFYGDGLILLKKELQRQKNMLEAKHSEL